MAGIDFASFYMALASPIFLGFFSSLFVAPRIGYSGAFENGSSGAPENGSSGAPENGYSSASEKPDC
ncbi:hypothetical protein [Achromobacter animicus]|uniref:hypothetical protein n=1 Tax=Achromobacter animicus TaxID=1389935 RepID=UPI0028A6E6D0|nr:hypothetical protein [Achromobacter animicus]